VNALEAYVPGEQPREAGYVKLNTNESPYPPAPDVIAAVREAAAEGAFNKYPDPASMSLRDAIAERIQVPVSQILVGNGSDEVLRLVCHAFLRPGTDDCIGMVYPTYVLYRTLAAMFGAGCFAFEVSGPDYAIPDDAYLSPARVFFLANPNPPLGTRYARAEVARLAAADPDRLLVVDEAYVDFSEGDMMEVFREFSNVAITRTFSKSYSLAGMRVGFIVAREPLISQLEKIKDSYNLNRVSQVAAEAAWKAISYYDEKSGLICENRGFLAEELQIRGFEVPASSGNFVFARRRDAAELYRKLKEQRILVRYFDAPALRDGLRITVGTRPELNALLSALDTM
jgi:histidinol-phosphate aminotransferase